MKEGGDGCGSQHGWVQGKISAIRIDETPVSLAIPVGDKTNFFVKFRIALFLANFDSKLLTGRLVGRVGR
jgi:hypothetical protein